MNTDTPPTAWDDRFSPALPFHASHDRIPITVCVDCTIERENGEAPLNPDCEPWSLIEDGQTVTADHGETDDGVEYGYDEFSTSPCDACGTRLAGTRYRYALWL